MRLISLLIGLVIIMYLMSKTLAPTTTKNNINEIVEKQGITLPQVPTSAQDLKKFEADINNFIQDTTTKRQQELEKALN